MGILPELLPARFIALTMHGCAIVSSYFLKVESIEVTLQATSRRYTTSQLRNDYRNALSRVQVVLVWSLVCFIIEFVGLFSAYSLTWPRATLYNAVAHTFGAFFVFWAQLDSWSYVAYEYNFVFFTFLPALVELFIIPLSARRYWMELHADTGEPLGAPSKVCLNESQLVMIVSASVLAVVGVPLAVEHVHRSISTGRKLDVAAWFGLIMSSTSLVLALIVLDQKVRIVAPKVFEDRSEILRRQDSSPVETMPLKDELSR